MILIVEDNPDTSDWYIEILESIGYHAEVVTDGETAVEKAAKNNYALILMDWRLPGAMSGVAAASEIRKLPSPYCHVPMVVLTGGMTTTDMHLLPEASFDSVMQKPFATKKLISTVKRLAQRRL